MVRAVAAGLFSHIIHCWRDITHKGHQEEGQLQDGMLDEGEGLDDLLVPMGALQVENEREEP